MAKKTKSATVPITKVSIENVSKWPTQLAVRVVTELIHSEYAYIMSHRDVGCTFRHKSGVNIDVMPVSKESPEDTLDFYSYNSMEELK